MLKMNNAMKNKMSLSLKSANNNADMEILANEIVIKTKEVKDCVIYDSDDSIKERAIDFERVIKFSGDFTGYEVGCNEINFSSDEYEINEMLRFIESLKEALELKYCKKQFCVILSMDEFHFNVRFHTYRENEGMWLDSDLEGYGEAIAYII